MIDDLDSSTGLASSRRDLTRSNTASNAIAVGYGGTIRDITSHALHKPLISIDDLGYEALLNVQPAASLTQLDAIKVRV